MGEHKFRGTKQPLNWGTQTITGFIVDTMEDTIEGEESEIEDENGDVVGHFSGYGIRHKRTASVIPLPAAEEPAPGDAFTIGTGDATFAFIIKSVKKSRTKKDVEKWDIEGSFYDDVPMTPVE